MLNFQQFSSANKFNYPYLHVLVSNLISIENIQTLVKQLPIANEKLTIRNWGSDKVYKVRNSVLYDLHFGKQVMPKPWEQLIDFLTCNKYKQSIAKMLGPSILKSDIEIIFKRYFPGDYISPHTDRDFVYGTHLLFFNQVWYESWGGLLQVLTPEAKIVKQVPPLYNTSFLFIQGKDSWHAVNVIKNNADIRFCLQVTFWRHKNKIRTPGRIEI